MNSLNISAALVKDLREKTGAGMMDCKKALTEANGNFEEAVDLLRKRGLSAAAKKSGRVVAEGLVALQCNSLNGAMIELNSETDFVAKNDKFQSFATSLVAKFLNDASADVEGFKATEYQAGQTVEQSVVEHIAVIGENISLRRAAKLSVTSGAVVGYIHNVVADMVGKIGVLVALESKADASLLQELGKQVAMHIAAFKPESLSVADLDQALIEKERQFLREQAIASGKPADVVEKMLDGRMSKFYEQVVLLEQPFVMDNKIKVKDAIQALAKQIGADVTLKAFARFTLGEGVEKQEENFAEEVAKIAAR